MQLSGVRYVQLLLQKIYPIFSNVKAAVVAKYRSATPHLVAYFGSKIVLRVAMFSAGLLNVNLMTINVYVVHDTDVCNTWPSAKVMVLQLRFEKTLYLE